MAAQIASLALERTRRGKQAHLNFGELLQLILHERANGKFSDDAQCLIVIFDPKSEQIEDYSANLDRAGAIDLLQSFACDALRELAPKEI